MNHFAINTALFQLLIKMFSFDFIGVSTVSQQVCFDGLRGFFFKLAKHHLSLAERPA